MTFPPLSTDPETFEGVPPELASMLIETAHLLNMIGELLSAGETDGITDLMEVAAGLEQRIHSFRHGEEL